MIRIENVVKKYDENIILNNISLNIEKGNIFGLVGTSGAGKSTILKIINGLESISEGNLVVNDIDVSSLINEKKRNFQKKIGMIFQNFALLERRNVFDNVAFPLRCAKEDKDVINNKVEYLLKKVGIYDKKNAMPAQLSGGQRQRVAIARALSLDPDILLCDEATSGLDPRTTITILDLLKDINKKDNLTIIVVTHELDVVERICDRVAIVEHGKIKASGLVEEVLFDYFSNYELSNYFECEEFLYLKIQYHNTSENKKLFSNMSIATNIVFEIEDGEIQYLKNVTISSFIIKIKKDDHDRITEYLDENKIQYNRVRGEE